MALKSEPKEILPFAILLHPPFRLNGYSGAKFFEGYIQLAGNYFFIEWKVSFFLSLCKEPLFTFFFLFTTSFLRFLLNLFCFEWSAVT
jgi:hypothetical protein